MDVKGGQRSAHCHPVSGSDQMKFLHNARSWFSQRRTMNELRNLSNEALDDIGLTRFDVNMASAQRFTR
jgi:uncharacterized protein YjiS (DUF1127 family)